MIGGSGVLCGALARALGRQGAAVVVVGHSHLDVAQAVAAARRALEGPWGTMPPSEREAVLRRLGMAQ